ILRKSFPLNNDDSACAQRLRCTRAGKGREKKWRVLTCQSSTSILDTKEHTHMARRFLAAGAILFFAGSLILFAANRPEQTWQGYVTDTYCGFNRANKAPTKSCTLECIKNEHAKYAFYNFADKTGVHPESAERGREVRRPNGHGEGHGRRPRGICDGKRADRWRDHHCVFYHARS